MTKKLSVQTELTQGELSSIQQLRGKMEQKGFKYKLDLNIFNNRNEQIKYLLYKEEERLTGYAVMSSFDPAELEVAIIMEPKKEIFKAIDEALKSYVMDREITAMLVILGKQDQYLQDCLDQSGYIYAFSEYRMTLDFQQFASFSLSKANLSLEPALPTETKMIAQLEESQDQSEEEQSMCLNDLEKTIVAKVNDEIVASMRIEEEQNCYAIYGFVVKEQLRGQGIGRQFLLQVIQEILKKEPKEIYLEVSTENEPACYLYGSVGFQTKAHFDYYSVCF